MFCFLFISFAFAFGMGDGWGRWGGEGVRDKADFNRWDGEPSDDDVHGPRDDEGGVGGGGKGKRTRRMSGTTASGSRSVLGVEGTEGTGSKAVGAAAEKKREGFGLEVDTLAQSDVEREIVEMTRRFERKQLARRMEVEKEEEREGELSLH